MLYEKYIVRKIGIYTKAINLDAGFMKAMKKAKKVKSHIAMKLETFIVNTGLLISGSVSFE